VTAPSAGGPAAAVATGGPATESLGTLADLLRGADTVLLTGSRDPNAKLTAIVLARSPRPDSVRVTVKVPTTAAAAAVVAAEGRLLAALADLDLGALAASLPAVVGHVDADGLPAMVTTGLAGVPMQVGYHGWRHTARRSRVAADFAAAGGWLAALQAATASGSGPVGFAGSSLIRIEDRFPGHPALAAVRPGLSAAADRLERVRTPYTVLHGDFWAGNLLLRAGRVAGVVDWESGRLSGEPLRDVVRFALSYALYLDRHTRPGRPVPGHPGLRADGFGAGVAAALAGRGWFGALVRDFVTGALVRLGAPAGLWRDALLAGVAEVAAGADHRDFAAAHLQLLAELAGRPPAPDAVDQRPSGTVAGARTTRRGDR
ncbi:MAG TPA: phosphotransferase, partial [Mycobacteriales bacterium]|nr:phosphotransferase [Mycobacteriales bacterium]